MYEFAEPIGAPLTSDEIGQADLWQLRYSSIPVTFMLNGIGTSLPMNELKSGLKPVGVFLLR
jgi:hypothetical protein